MFSTTSKEAPRPKLRVTCRNCTPGLPQLAQGESDKVGRDDDKSTGRADFDNGFRDVGFEGFATDDELGFAALPVALALDDFAGEDDIFEIEDRKLVIFECLCGMYGNKVIQRTNELAETADRRAQHKPIIRGRCRIARSGEPPAHQSTAGAASAISVPRPLFECEHRRQPSGQTDREGHQEKFEPGTFNPLIEPLWVEAIEAL